ncbi:MAG: hypothetical protein MK052_04120 [Alphaproteobacteria bacterium]|nr:hypothetical protein [Alphaproteobacteria bacterium]
MSVLDQWQDRWEFAAYNHEQRFQTELVTKRRLFNAIVNYPLTQIQNDLLRPDLIQRDPVSQKKVKKVEFDAAAWRFIDDALIGAGGGQFVRSFAFAYSNNKDFRDVHNASRALEGFGMAAESFDNAPKKLSEEIKDGRSHAVYDLVNHSAEASGLLDEFVHGRLDMSPTNVAKLQNHLSAMSALCEEKADMREAYDKIRDPEARAKAEARGDGNEASGYIRDVIRLDSITTPRQAQILSGFVAAVMVDAATPLGTEMYIPQSDIFMPPEDAVKLSDFVEKQMDSRGFIPNVSLNNNPRPFDDVPEGMMVKQTHNPKTGEITGHEKLTQAETMSFANAIHGYINTELGGKIENMLRYVDKHFDEIEESISRSQEDPAPAPIPVWDKHHPKGSSVSQFQDKLKDVWDKGRHTSPIDMMKGVGSVATVAAKHITRPQAMFENQKLFGRAVAGQLVSYPVKVLDEALKSFLREGKGLDNLMEAAGSDGKKLSSTFGPSAMYALDDKGRKVLDDDGDPIITEKLNPLLDKEDFVSNLKSSTFRLFTAPIAASIGTVASQELYHVPKGFALDAAERADTVLTAAIKAGHRHAPEVAERMEAMDGPHPAIQDLMKKDVYKERLPEISAKKPQDRSEEDYEVLGAYYKELSEVCLSMAEEALSPYGVDVKPDRVSSMDEVVTRVLRRPAENMADAMISLAYVQSFVEVNADKTASMEYVDPSQLLIKHGDLRKLGNFVDKQAKSAGLSVAEEGEVDGVEAGELVERNKKTGKLEAASEETLIRYANVASEELKKYVDIDNLLFAVKGKHSEEYLGKIEDSLFGTLHYDIGNEKSTLESQLKDKAEVSEDLTGKWQDKVKRKPSSLRENIKQNLEHPEVKHEVRKLFGRSKGEAVSCLLPGLVYNKLQHQEDLFSRSGLYSAAFKTAVYPVLYSKGLVTAKEAINETVLRRRHIINETNLASSLIEGAITSAGELDGDMRNKMVESNQIHADMLALEKKDEFKDIPRIAAKPRELREDADHELMKQFCDEIGAKMVDNSTRIFNALNAGKNGEAVEDVMERALHKPVSTLSDAVISLGFVHSMLQDNANNLDVLTYVAPEDKVLDRKQLRAMSEFMNDQAANAGFAIHGVPVEGKNGNQFTVLGNDDSLREGEMLQWNDEEKQYQRASAEAVIRYANVVNEKFCELAEDRVKEDSENLVQKYQKAAKEQIFRNLKPQHDEMPQHEVDGRFGEIIANEVARGGFSQPPADSHQSRLLSGQDQQASYTR